MSRSAAGNCRLNTNRTSSFLARSISGKDMIPQMADPNVSLITSQTVAVCSSQTGVQRTLSTVPN